MWQSVGLVRPRGKTPVKDNGRPRPFSLEPVVTRHDPPSVRNVKSSPRSRFLLLILLAAALLLPFAASPGNSDAATWTVRGGGFGHGLGMSAYGAYGMGLDGYKYGRILRQYFRGSGSAS